MPRVYCVVYGCLNSASSKPELSFFKVPADVENKIITVILLAFASNTNGDDGTAVSGEKSCIVASNVTDKICHITVTCQDVLISDISADIRKQECIKIRNLDYSITLIADAIEDTNSLRALSDMLQKITKILIKNSAISKLTTTSMTNVEEICLISNKKFVTFDISEMSFNKVTKMDYSNNSIATLEGKSSNNFKNMKTLNLSCNLIEVIPMNYFESFSELLSLDLSHNKLNVFFVQGMFKLNTLNLSFNILKKVDDVYLKFEHLKVLYLSHNKISSVYNNSLKIMSELETLDLSSNQIDTLEEMIFETLLELKTLDLSENKIKYIPKTLLSNNKKLDKLSLNKNNIAGIEDRSFINSQIKEISVRNNNITKLGNGVFLGLQVNKLDLSNNNICQIDAQFKDVNSKLSEINLTNNDLSIISPLTFKDLNELQTLVLSHNRLTELHFDSSDLEKLNYLNASNNSITKIDDIFFKELKSLSILDLSINQINKFEFSRYELGKVTKLILRLNPLQTKIEQEELKNLKNVIDMDISKTKLTEFKEKAFFGMDKLKTLNSSGCALSKINQNAFSGAGSIEILDLSVNFLTEFLVTDMSNLKELYLNDNKITNISNLFINLPSLHTINLAQNKIQELQPKYFVTTVNLQIIDLSQNTDLVIDDNTFDDKNLKTVRLNKIKHVSFEKANNTSIEDLYLSDCEIQDIASVFITKVKTLRILDLSKNKIQFIAPKLFQELKLTNLNLSYNEIQYIAPNTFKGCDFLKNLDLHQNHLKFIDSHSLLGVKVLETLDLSANKISEFDINLLPMNNKPYNIHLDDNNLININFNDFLNTNVREISIGGNKIPCDNIKTILKNTKTTFKVTATKFNNEYSVFNGITCDKQETEAWIPNLLASLDRIQTQLRKNITFDSSFKHSSDIEEILIKLQEDVNNIPKNTSFVEVKDERNNTYIKDLGNKILSLSKILEHAAPQNESSYSELLNITKQMRVDLEKKLIIPEVESQQSAPSKGLLLSVAICSGSVLLLLIGKFSYSYIKSRRNT